MDNTTTWDRFTTGEFMGIGQHVTEIPTIINPYLQNTTNHSSLQISNSTQTNWTAADGAEDAMLSLTGLWVYLALRTLWGAIAIFGNGLTIWAVIRYERLQTCTNYLICSLAVSDLLVSVSVPLIIVYELYPKRWFFIPICLFQKTVSLISSSGNMMNILQLSIDRYIYVAFPLRYHSLVTPKKLVLILIVSWSYILLSVPTAIYTGNHLQIDMPCKYHVFLDSSVQFLFLNPHLFLVLCLTTGFHLAIAKIAHKQARQIQSEQQAYNTLAVAINQSTKKISRTLGLVLGVYIFSYMPTIIVSIISSKERHLFFLTRFTTLFYWSNTWINPLIYAWRLKDFRIAFKKIFTGTGHFNEVP